MGDAVIISNLIGRNFAQEAQEQQQANQDVLQQAQLYDYVLQDANAPFPLKGAAHKHGMDLLEEHGGKDLQEHLPVFGQFLGRLAMQSAVKGAQTRQLVARAQQQQAQDQQTQPPDAAAAAAPADTGTPVDTSTLANLPQQTQSPVSMATLAGLPTTEAPAQTASPVGVAGYGPTPGQPTPELFVNRLGALAGTSPQTAAPAQPSQPYVPFTLPAVPPHTRRQRIADALMAFGGGLSGRYAPGYLAEQQAAVRRAELTQQFQLVNQAVAQGKMTPEAGNEAIRYLISGERTPPATRATIEEQMLQDAMQAEADRLGKPLAQMTAAERVKVERSFAPQTKAQSLQQQEMEDALAAEEERLKRPLTHAERYEVERKVLEKPKTLSTTAEQQQWALNEKARELGRFKPDGVTPDPEQLTDLEKTQAVQAAKEGTLGAPIYDPDKPQPVLQPGQYNEEVLRGLPQNVVDLVKGLVKYNIPMPSSYAIARSPVWSKALAVAQQYDPTFNASVYDLRRRTMLDFTSGKASTNLRSINTLIGHLSRMRQSAQELNNIPSGKYGVATGAANWLRNLYREGKQDPRLTKFNDDANAVESELAAVFKGTGAPSLEEIKSWRAKVNSSSSPEELQTHVREAVELMRSRVDFLQAQYENNMDRPFHMRFLSLEAAGQLSQITGVPVDQVRRQYESGGGGGAGGGAGADAGGGGGQQGGGDAGGGGTVLMRAPNGQTWPVPADQVEHYRQKGATVVQ